LGSGYSGRRNHLEAVALNPQPLPPRGPEFGPVPDPWRNAAVHYLASLVSVKELAKTIDNKELGSQLAARAERGFSEFLDDFCGTPPRRIPWPYPGPPPWVATLVAELTSAANSLSGTFRDGLMGVAGRVAHFGQQSNAR
jgi:hypothetical protein